MFNLDFFTYKTHKSSSFFSRLAVEHFVAGLVERTELPTQKDQ